MKLVWSTPASLDLVALAENHAAFSATFATAVLDRIESQMQILERFPQIGRPGRQQGTSERPVPGTPYLIVSMIGNDEVRILNVLHGARKFPPEPE